MDKKSDIVFCLKITQKQWAEKLFYGSVCFNNPNYFIKKALLTGNNEQGDKYEGVFARVRINDSKYNEFLQRFGDDLEIIPDGEFVLLRRLSSRQVPVFCMFGIRKSELIPDEESIKKHGEKYFGEATYLIPEKMYKSFLDDADKDAFVPWGFYASAGHFYDAIEKALSSKEYVFIKKMVTYDIDLNDEFYIEPTSDFPELFHKRKELDYQHEVRYILPFISITDKLIIGYEPLSTHSAGIAPGELGLKMNVTFKYTK